MTIRYNRLPTTAARTGDSSVAIVGGGPAGLTAALLLARAGRHVTLFEAANELGGLWATRLDEDGYYGGENSCKVYQSSYHSAPSLFQLIGTDWQRHFVHCHDLTTDWLKPFMADCTWRDRRVLAGAYLAHRAGFGRYHTQSVFDFMRVRRLSEPCQQWLRATALGGIAGTMRMTMWELFHRVGSNVAEITRSADGPLYWNAQPPNSPAGFLTFWRRALDDLGVVVHTGAGVSRLHSTRDGALSLTTQSNVQHAFEAIFLAVPPPALAGLLQNSEQPIADGFGLSRHTLDAYLKESVYEHVGMTWFFDQDLPTDLPLGGHNARRGWHPILVQHAQYRAQLRAPAQSVVVGSIALDAKLRHHRLGTLACEHTVEELIQIVWEDERRVDPSLPEPISVAITGASSATQIVHRGPLPIKMRGLDVFLATNLHGQAPYFTASLEAAIQAGAIAARRFDPCVEQLPMGRSHSLPWAPAG